MEQEYSKPPLTYTQQVELLRSRGLVIDDFLDAERFLKQVNYYRFSAYCLPFQKSHDVFYSDTSFEKVIDLYRLDESLRREILSLITQIEIFLRTRTVYEFSHGWGSFAHYNSRYFRNNFNHIEWISYIEGEILHSKEVYLVPPEKVGW